MVLQSFVRSSLGPTPDFAGDGANILRYATVLRHCTQCLKLAGNFPAGNRNSNIHSADQLICKLPYLANVSALIIDKFNVHHSVLQGESLVAPGLDRRVRDHDH
ncbi:hypothetical protein TNCV_3123331 [Trichonephila clavipes]|nr:hypothetical protein TNCV_3123331 [Trichonephila clavipes]